ncbi:MAG: hypothetical protein ACI9KE_005591 [Polyangiales bacterium]|jgi:hypothetical protein
MMQTRSLVALALLLSLSSCVEKSRDLTRTEREQLAQFVGEEATSPTHEVSIDFEGKVELIGYDLSSETWTPGEQMTITWHWKVTRALEEGWRLFTHVSDGRQPTVVNEDGAGLVRDLYQPGAWKAGEYVRDRQVITLPADWGASTAVVYVGLWNGPHRLRITDGPSDGDNRARAATVRTGGTPEAAPSVPGVPSLMAGALPAGNPLVLDGELNEAAWQTANSSRALVNTMSGAAADFRVTVKTLFDAENFYVGFIVADTFLKSEFDEHDQHLWEADVVEIMVDPDGDGRNYFELQVSPGNVSFDTRYDSRRVPQPIGHADWDSNLRSGVSLRGTLNDDEADEGYTVEIAIPWTAFAHGTPPASPPSAGDEWRVNFYVMDVQEDGTHAAAWSAPRVGDFHVPARFGRIQFGEAPPEVAPTPAPTRPGVPVQALPGIREQMQRHIRPRGQIETETERHERDQPQGGERNPAPPVMQ